MKRSDKDRLLAAALTLVVVLLILLLIFAGRLSFTPPAGEPRAEAELMEEELFVEPLLTDLGEETSPQGKGEAAPTLKGEPEPAPADRTEIVTPGAAKTSRSSEDVAVAKRESKLKKEEAAATEKEKQRATSSVASKFSSKNGSAEGSDEGASGAGGAGVGVSGNARGRTFRGCPIPDVTLRHKTIVTVNVVIDAEGNVTEATASGSADAAIRRKCEAAARGARWSPKKGAAVTRGSITFTITPK